MKKSYFFTFILLIVCMGFFNDNNAISKNDLLLSLIGKNMQTNMGLFALGASATALYFLNSFEINIKIFNSRTGHSYNAGKFVAIANQLLILLGGFGAWETYQGIKGLRKKIKNYNTAKQSE